MRVVSSEPIRRWVSILPFDAVRVDRNPAAAPLPLVKPNR